MGFARPTHLEKIDGLRAAGSRTGLRDLRAQQRIDHARFADVGAAKERNFRHCGSREVRHVDRRGHEFRKNSHNPVSNVQRELASRKRLYDRRELNLARAGVYCPRLRRGPDDICFSDTECRQR